MHINMHRKAADHIQVKVPYTGSQKRMVSIRILKKSHGAVPGFRNRSRYA
jgi:hypothetical protein